MRRAVALLLVVGGFAVASALLLGGARTAQAHPHPRPHRGPDCTVEVLVDGRPLAEHAARGTRYIEAQKGREYAVRITNRTARRLAVALAVDGLNSIDAQRTSPEAASKWVIGPHQSVTISGWQVSSGTARRFFFTTEERSYGAWLGETSALGTISAAVYRERIRAPQPLVQRRPAPPTPWFGAGSEDKRSEAQLEGRSEPSAADAPGAVPDSASPASRPTLGGSAENEAQSSALRDTAAAERKSKSEYAATGIGQELSHSVREVELELEDSPSQRIEVRYEFREALVRLGVLPPADDDGALARRERGRGFEGGRWAPDPLRR